MAATMLIREKNGAGETPTDKTSGTVRFKNADNATVDTVNRLVVPAAGSEWSFQKFLRLNVAGTFTDIQNLKFFMDGANNFGTGINLWAQDVVAYATPAEETGSGGYTDAFTFTTGAPLDIGAGPFTVAGDIGDYVQMAMEVLSTAGAGALVAETATFQFDET